MVPAMKTLTIRLPDDLLRELEAAAHESGTTVSSVLRDRAVSYGARRGAAGDTLSLIADLAGSVGGTPSDLSSRTKHYLKQSGYGERPR